MASVSTLGSLPEKTKLVLILKGPLANRFTTPVQHPAQLQPIQHNLAEQGSNEYETELFSRGDDDDRDTPAPEPEGPHSYLCFDNNTDIPIRCGRRKGNNVRFPAEANTAISREHFMIRFQRESRVWFIECHSKSGMLVDGTRIGPGVSTTTIALSPKYGHPTVINVAHVVIKVYVIDDWNKRGRGYDDPLPRSSVTRCQSGSGPSSHGHGRTHLSLGRQALLQRKSSGLSMASSKSFASSASAVSETAASETTTSGISTDVSMKWMDTYPESASNARGSHEYYLRDWEQFRWKGACFAVSREEPLLYICTQFNEEDRVSIATVYGQLNMLQTAGLQHPNLMPLLDVETTSSGKPFLIQSLLSTDKLADNGSTPWPSHVDDASLNTSSSAALTRQLIGVLAVIHKHGVCHGHISSEFLLRTTPNFFLLNGLWLRSLEENLRQIRSPTTARSSRPMPEEYRADLRALGALINEKHHPSNDKFTWLQNDMSSPAEPVAIADPLLSSVRKKLMSGDTDVTAAILDSYLRQLLDDGSDQGPFSLEKYEYKETFELENNIRGGEDVQTAQLINFFHRCVRGSYQVRFSQINNPGAARIPLDQCHKFLRNRLLYPVELSDPYRPGHMLNATRIVTATASFLVPWLRNCHFVNFTILLKWAGIPSSDVLMAPPRHALEIRGDPEFAGLFVKYDWAQKHLPDDVRNRIVLPRCDLASRLHRLTRYTWPGFALFATGLPFANVVVVDQDGRSLWEPLVSEDQTTNWHQLEKTFDLCASHGLHALEDDIRAWIQGLPAKFKTQDVNGPQWRVEDDDYDELAFKRQLRPRQK